MTTTYGDISPRTAAYVQKDLLKRGMPHLVLEKFGQAVTLPGQNTKTVSFRRYNALPTTPVALTEGVTPTALNPTKTDITATVEQYGGHVEITDVVMDTHEDPVLQEFTGMLGEQAAQIVEKVRFGVLKAGTNVLYANGSSRGSVTSAISLAMQRRATRALKRQNANKITSIVRSTPAFGTEPVAPGYVGLVHPDCERDIREMAGFVPAEKYGSLTPWDNELGKVEDVRYVTSTIFEPWADAGGAAGAMLSTTGTSADVYPVLWLARDAYGIVALKGMFAVTPLVHNPKPSASDPLAQRGSVGWKTMQTAVILNQAWMIRGEVAATA